MGSENRFKLRVSAFGKISVIMLLLLLRAEIPKRSCFWNFTYFQNGVLFPESI